MRGGGSTDLKAREPGDCPREGSVGRRLDAPMPRGDIRISTDC